MQIELKTIPKSAGVYLFLDEKGQILYIGKAAVLRARLKNYFPYRGYDSRIQKMLELANSIKWQETISEIEALILESQLIKQNRPIYNIRLRDDKQYFYVGITKEEFPKIFITHQPGSKNQNLPVELVGPFTDGGSLKSVLKMLRRIFPYCSCKQKHHNYCLNYHIGKCLGFCCIKERTGTEVEKLEESKVYKQNIKSIKSILSGEKASLIKNFKKEMLELGQKIIKDDDFPPVGGSASGGEKAIDLRNKIAQLEQVFANAQIVGNSPLKVIPKSSKKLLQTLKRELGLKEIPVRIEGYDISNIQGVFATGAMVVFTDGKPDKNQYRKFKIRIGGIANDTAMLKEMLGRRLNHSEWRYPDLIIVDGGKGQLSAINDVVLKNKIPVVALTKNEQHRGDHIYINNKKVSLSLKDLSQETRNLILQIDTEAHRFAISYYRKLHRFG